MSETGERCPAVKWLELDHIDEVARGGEATTDRMRLRCRAHNQFEAERTFGTEFMQRKREDARRVAAERRAAVERAAAAKRAAAERAAAAQRAAELDVVPCTKLGSSAARTMPGRSASLSLIVRCPKRGVITVQLGEDSIIWHLQVPACVCRPTERCANLRALRQR